jgi:transposase
VEKGELEGDIHASCRQRIAALEKVIQTLLQENQELKERIRRLEHRLGMNSSNSSKPPSTDPPGTPPPAKPPSGRKPGGQPGHPPARRPDFKKEQVDHFVHLHPKVCRYCGRPFASHQLLATAPVCAIHQLVDVPPVSAEVTEIQAHWLECVGCGTLTSAEIPDEILMSIVGPRLQALASLLSGRFRLSRREVQEALVAIFGPKAEVSLGTVSNLERETSEALAPIYEEAHQAAQEASRANFDETGWREGRKRAWLWVMATATLTVFRICRERSRQAFEALAGAFKGVLCSDRWRVYMHWPKRLHQLCWAHLKRVFTSWSELGGKEGKIGEGCRTCEGEVFVLWHRFKAREITYGTLLEYLRPVQSRLRRWLRRGTRCPPIAHACKELLEFWPCLWVFVHQEGVEPTNNEGEREIRPAVLWRKGSFGSHSPEGSRFAERMLTVSRSLRKQGRGMVDFLVDAIVAHRQGKCPPSILPARGRKTKLAAG